MKTNTKTRPFCESSDCDVVVCPFCGSSDCDDNNPMRGIEIAWVCNRCKIVFDRDDLENETES